MTEPTPETLRKYNEPHGNEEPFFLPHYQAKPLAWLPFAIVLGLCLVAVGCVAFGIYVYYTTIGV